MYNYVKRIIFSFTLWLIVYCNGNYLLITKCKLQPPTNNILLLKILETERIQFDVILNNRKIKENQQADTEDFISFFVMAQENPSNFLNTMNMNHLIIV